MSEPEIPRQDVLIADDDLHAARALADVLRRAGYEPTITTGGARLKQRLSEREFSVVICGVETAGS